MPSQLFKHVVKKTQPGKNICLTSTVQIKTHQNLSFVGITLDKSGAGRVLEKLVYTLPIDGGQSCAGVSLLPYQDRLASQIDGQFHIG